MMAQRRQFFVHAICRDKRSDRTSMTTLQQRSRTRESLRESSRKEKNRERREGKRDEIDDTPSNKRKNGRKKKGEKEIKKKNKETTDVLSLYRLRRPNRHCSILVFFVRSGKKKRKKELTRRFFHFSDELFVVVFDQPHPLQRPKAVLLEALRPSPSSAEAEALLVDGIGRVNGGKELANDNLQKSSLCLAYSNFFAGLSGPPRDSLKVKGNKAHEIEKERRRRRRRRVSRE